MVYLSDFDAGYECRPWWRIPASVIQRSFTSFAMDFITRQRRKLPLADMSQAA